MTTMDLLNECFEHHINHQDLVMTFDESTGEVTMTFLSREALDDIITHLTKLRLQQYPAEN